jgi:hypothetical protein
MAVAFFSNDSAAPGKAAQRVAVAGLIAAGSAAVDGLCETLRSSVRARPGRLRALIVFRSKSSPPRRVCMCATGA